MELTNSTERKLNDLNPKDRHSLIDQSLFISEIKAAYEGFSLRLEELEKIQITLQDQDPIRDALDEIFDERVGAQLSSEIVSKLAKSWDQRKSEGRPPGTRDDIKHKDPDPVFYYAQQAYEKRIGDLLVWEQIKAHTKEKEIRSVVFLTDDAKDDWWWSFEALGRNRLGPRPELVEEIKREAGAEYFYMYGSYQFIEHAQNLLNAPVEPQIMEQIRDISILDSSSVNYFELPYSAVIKAVREWIVQNNPHGRVEERLVPDWIVQFDGGKIIQYDLLAVDDIYDIKEHLPKAFDRGFNFLNDDTIMYCQILLCKPSREIDNLVRKISSEYIAAGGGRFQLIVGGITGDFEKLDSLQFSVRLNMS